MGGLTLGTGLTLAAMNIHMGQAHLGLELTTYLAQDKVG